VSELQLDLFGEVEAEEAAAVRKLEERAAWQARFERADWVAPWDTGSGMKKGESCSGWRCPDPACGEVEPNEYLLSINHGFDPSVPGHAPYNGNCMRFLRAQTRPHKLHNVHPQPDGTFTADCTCRDLDGITAATEDQLVQQIEEHRLEVTAELAPIEGWR
jgi:hypothetical protein